MQSGYFQDDYFPTIYFNDLYWAAFGEGLADLLLNDSVALSDIVTFMQGKTLADSLSITDGTTKYIWIVKPDTLNLTENQTKAISSVRVDTTVITDQKAFSFSTELSDTLALSDLDTWFPGLILYRSEFVSLSDSSVVAIVVEVPYGPGELYELFSFTAKNTIFNHVATTAAFNFNTKSTIFNFISGS